MIANLIVKSSSIKLPYLISFSIYNQLDSPIFQLNKIFGVILRINILC